MSITKNDILEMCKENLRTFKVGTFIFENDDDILNAAFPDGYKTHLGDSELIINERIKNNLSSYIKNFIDSNFIKIINEYIKYNNITKLSDEDLDLFEYFIIYYGYELSNDDIDEIIKNPLFIEVLSSDDIHSSFVERINFMDFALEDLDDNNKVEDEQSSKNQQLNKENLELIRKYQETKDMDIIGELYEKNKPLIDKQVAKAIRKYRLEPEDIHQIASITLISAVENFDFSKKTLFSTFLVPSINNEIYKENAKSSRLLNVSYRLNTVINKVYKAANTLRMELCREPSSEEIAAYLEMPVEDVNDAFKYNNQPKSLDDPVDGNDSEDSVFGDFIASNIETPYDNSETIDVRIDFEKILYIYSKKLKNNKPILYIRLNKGLANYETEEFLSEHPEAVEEHYKKVYKSMCNIYSKSEVTSDLDRYTLYEIAKMFGVSHQAIGQALSIHLKKIQKLYDAYLDNPDIIKSYMSDLKDDKEWNDRRVRTIKYLKDNNK